MGDIGATASVFEERQALRCPSCDLAQFVTAENKCRRCRTRLALPEELPRARPEVDRSTVVATPPIVLQRFGATLAALRRDRRMSQKQAAEAMGIARTYFSKVESGRRIPTLANLARIAAAVGVPIADLLDDRAAQRLESARALRQDPFLRAIRDLARGLDGRDQAAVIAMARKLALQRQLRPPAAARVQ